MLVHYSVDCGRVRHYQFRQIRSPIIRFSVKAERDVAICLAAEPKNGSTVLFEIFIGCWGGGKSGIRREQKEDVLIVQTPDILTPNQFRLFWINVSGGFIKVGKNHENVPFMVFHDINKLKNIKYYGYCTGFGATGEWRFDDETGFPIPSCPDAQSGSTQVYHTIDCGKKHEYMSLKPIRSNEIRFSVKAPRDAAICLSSDTRRGGKVLYEIFLGGWGGGKSAIRREQREDVISVSTPDILNSNEFRSFWITCSNGFVKVGKQWQTEPFMSIQDPGRLRDVKYFGYCTSYGASGDWLFSD